MNWDKEWEKWLRAFKVQSLVPDKTLIIDSTSSDNTVKIAESYGLEVMSIDKKDFNHGSTRQLALTKVNDFGIVVYFTQDAILSDKNSLNNIVSSFHDSSIGAVYGRQLPRDQAGVFEYYERYFNYPCHSLKKEFSDRNIYGVKTPFISNSFAAYRVKALQEVGGFPSDVIMAEDMYVAAKDIKPRPFDIVLTWRSNRLFRDVRSKPQSRPKRGDFQIRHRGFRPRWQRPHSCSMPDGTAQSPGYRREDRCVDRFAAPVRGRGHK